MDVLTIYTHKHSTTNPKNTHNTLLLDARTPYDVDSIFMYSLRRRATPPIAMAVVALVSHPIPTEPNHDVYFITKTQQESSLKTYKDGYSKERF